MEHEKSLEIISLKASEAGMYLRDGGCGSHRVVPEEIGM